LITVIAHLRPAGRAFMARPAFFHRIQPGPQLPCNFPPGAVFLETTSIIIMKTLLSILSILALTMAAMSLDTYQLDVGDWLTAAMVAAMFGFALNDTQRAPRSFLRLR
jgi:hypothetical protein